MCTFGTFCIFFAARRAVFTGKLCNFVLSLYFFAFFGMCLDFWAARRAVLRDNSVILYFPYTSLHFLAARRDAFLMNIQALLNSCLMEHPLSRKKRQLSKFLLVANYFQLQLLCTNVVRIDMGCLVGAVEQDSEKQIFKCLLFCKMVLTPS